MSEYQHYLEVSNRILKELCTDTETKSIFHYTSFVGLNGIISNQELWFTNRFYLNDTSEGVYIFNLFLKYAPIILDGLGIHSDIETFLAHLCPLFASKGTLQRHFL